MHDDFDPYLHWLGIGPHERPVDHYRLLGVGRFETDLALIGAAADERMTYVRSFQTGPRGSHTQRLLNDLATARVCLLNPRTKATYDDFLRGLASVNPGGPITSAPTDSNSVALPPSVGAFAPAAVHQGFPLPAAIPMATPVAHPYPGVSTGQFPLALPVAGPATSIAASAAAPVSYLPTPLPTAPPRPESAQPPVSHAPRTDPESRATEPSSPTAEEPTESITSRRWFPLAVLGGVVMVAGVVWGVGQYLNQPATVEQDPGAARMDEEAETEADNNAQPKKPPDDYPSEVFLAQESNGDINFPASVARLLGPTLTLNAEGADPVILGWSGDDDAVSWDFRVVRPDIFRVEITYAADAAWAGGQFVVAVGDAEKSGEVVDSGGPGTFRTDKIFLPVRRKGKQTLTVRTVRRQGEQLWVLKSIRFAPTGAAGK